MKSKKKCSKCTNSSNNIVSIKKSNTVSFNDLLKRISKDIKLPSFINILEYHPKKYDLQLKLQLGKKNANRYVFFFGAYPINNSKYQIMHETKSYGNITNKGICKTNITGECNIKLKCPQPYRDNTETYQPHIHFLISNKQNTKWNLTLKTHTVTCPISHPELLTVLNKNSALIINALPYEYYIKSRIPMSISLPYKYLLDSILNEQNIDQYLKTMLVHSNKLNNHFKKGNINLKDIPIISYCWDNKCNAGHILKDKLSDFGYTNIRIYEPGIVGWNKKKNL